ncbi:MAG: hypothetical protein FJZ01_18935, partial [Candidatus Sericytochromatia bacterium]|nr:hypothetical protein [Candidatus Tanganyikabacteria bacterium]
AAPEPKPLLAAPEPPGLLGAPAGGTLDPAAIDAALDQMLGEVESGASKVVPAVPADDEGDGLLARMLADEELG